MGNYGRMRKMNKRHVERALNESIRQFLYFDSYLLKIDANERSISHRLAVHIEKHFPGWDVDCEYNRNRYDPKRLNIKPRNIRSDDLKGTTVYPDIIIHKRGTSNNYVVIEMKKESSTERDEYDLQKLQAFKIDLSYKIAIFVKVKTGDDYKVNPLQWLD